MKIKEFFSKKINITSFAVALLMIVILTIYIATSQSKFVIEKELEFNLDIVESEEWNKRTLITGEELNRILSTIGATKVVFGYEEDYATEISNIESTAVGFVNDIDATKEFKKNDIKLYTVTDSENNKIALILSKYQIKANADSSKMFYNLETLTHINFTNFETTSVENMDCMFYGLKNVTELSLNKFNTKSLTNISNMFYNCNSLKTVYVSDLWDINQITTAQENVFYNCTKLVGGNGTTYDIDNPIITSKYACIDTKKEGEMPAISGYFTYKSSDTEEEPITFNLARPSVTEKTDIENNTTGTTNDTNIPDNTITTNNETTNTTSSSNTTNETTNSSQEDTKNDEDTTTTNNANTNNVGDTNNTTTESTTTTSQDSKPINDVKDEEETKEQEIENNIEITSIENVVTN